jgi:hypothetical protein
MSDIDQEVLDAFSMMWGLYPAPVLLIHADRDIIACNRAAQEAGVPVGIKCHSMYPSDVPCPGCRANAALKKGEAIRRGAYVAAREQFLDSYWIPVMGHDDLYVHFGSDITEFVKPELLTE